MGVKWFKLRKKNPNNLGELLGDNDYATWHCH
jgi:hypothetical protein